LHTNIDRCGLYSLLKIKSGFRSVLRTLPEPFTSIAILPFPGTNHVQSSISNSSPRLAVMLRFRIKILMAYKIELRRIEGTQLNIKMKRVEKKSENML